MKTLTLVEGDNLWCSKKGCHLCDDDGIVKKVNNNMELLLEDEIYDRIYPVIIEERKRRGCDECSNNINNNINNNIDNNINDVHNFAETLKIYQTDMEKLLENKKEEYESLINSYNEVFKFKNIMLENLINSFQDRINEEKNNYLSQFENESNEFKEKINNEKTNFTEQLNIMKIEKNQLEIELKDDKLKLEQLIIDNYKLKEENEILKAQVKLIMEKLNML